jgi:hypothetical protein
MWDDLDRVVAREYCGDRSHDGQWLAHSEARRMVHVSSSDELRLQLFSLS